MWGNDERFASVDRARRSGRARLSNRAGTTTTAIATVTTRRSPTGADGDQTCNAYAQATSIGAAAVTTCGASPSGYKDANPTRANATTGTARASNRRQATAIATSATTASRGKRIELAQYVSSARVSVPTLHERTYVC